MRSVKEATKRLLAAARVFAKKYRLGIAVVIVIFGIWSVAGAYALHYFDQQRASQLSFSQKEIEKLDKAIERATEKKEQERFEEEKKAKEAAEAETRKKAEEAATKSQQQANPELSGGSCNQSNSHNNPASIDVMVNKKHCLQPLSFAPPDLVTTHGATISAKAASDFNRMFADAAAAGQPFSVTSSYRSYGTQVSTYNYWVSVNGQAAADTVSARPGFSEHQTGLAVDVGANGCNLNCFGSTSQYHWLQTNAANYGFIQRYYAGYEGVTGYSGEEWHYRYVGVATAQDMKAKGIMSLEQYWGMEGGNYR